MSSRDGSAIIGVVLIERELWAPGDPDGDEEPSLIGLLRASDDRVELLRDGLVVFAASWEHWALGTVLHFVPGMHAEEQPPPPGSKRIRTVYPDGRVQVILEPES